MEQTKYFVRNNQVQQYTVSFEADDYLYEFELEDCLICISSGGVSIICEGGAVHTNITPISLFPDSKELNNLQLCQILDTLEQTGYEGFFIDAEQLNNQVWEDIATDDDFPF